MTDSTQPDWHLQEWLAHFQKRQASLVNELGWNKSKANLVFHGKQPYTRSIINEISAWLGIEPFELLMAPDEALALRQLRMAARTIAANSSLPIAAEQPRPFTPAPPLAHGRR